MFNNLGLPNTSWPFKKDSISWNHLLCCQEYLASKLVYTFQHFHFANFPEDAEYFSPFS